MDRKSPLAVMVTAHPARISALGILPLVAASSTLAGSALIGFGFLLVLVASCVSLSLLRNLVPSRTRLVYMLLITATWVTVLDMLLQVYLYELRWQLGIYLPLMAMNSFLLWVMEKDALTRPVRSLVSQALKLSVLPVSLCLASGFIREWLVTGQLAMSLQGQSGAGMEYPLSLSLIGTATGAFLVTGCLLALINLFVARSE